MVIPPVRLFHVKHGFVSDRVGGCPCAGDDTELQPSPGRAAQRKATRDTQPLANVWSAGHVRENGPAITVRVPTALPTVYQSAQARSGELLRQPLHLAYPCLPAGRARRRPFVAKFHVKPGFRPGAGQGGRTIVNGGLSLRMGCVKRRQILGKPPCPNVDRSRTRPTDLFHMKRHARTALPRLPADPEAQYHEDPCLPAGQHRPTKMELIRAVLAALQDAGEASANGRPRLHNVQRCAAARTI
jgi:hypothetical protein